MKAIALDDERPALDVIDAFCSRIDSVQLVKTFTKSGEARLFLESNEVNLIFLDINMPRESGLDFAASVAQRPQVIFTTAYSEYAVESYNLEAADYLLKPFTFARFEQAVTRAQTKIRAERQLAGTQGDDLSKSFLYFRVDFNLVKVVLADILFIEGLDNYLKIHLKNGQPLVVRLTLKMMLDKLPESNFIRVHRSYIVALDKVQSAKAKMIQIGQEEIPVGSSYEKDFLSRLPR